MGSAVFVKKLDGFTGDAALYHLDPPFQGYSWSDAVASMYAHVIVSATIIPHSGPETYIFGASEDGEVLDWIELPGSFRGALDHEEALRGAGYGVVEVSQD